MLLGLLIDPAAAQPPGDSAEETSQIRQAAESYLAALKQGDTARLQSLWTATGDFVDSLGHVTKGRDLVRTSGKPVAVAGDKSATIGTIRLITPDVAIEDGTVELSAQGQEPAFARYSAIWVKRNGQWLLDGVRESLAHAHSHRDRLRPLAWMVGDWQAEGASGRIELSCHWSPDGNFLLREMKVQAAQGPALAVTQRIGWDASQQRIVAWAFDSEGGHGTSTWSPRDGGWVVNASGVLPEGQTTRSTSTITRQGDNSFTWEMSQSVAGVAQPDRKLEFTRRRAAGNGSGTSPK
jgi:uncharacterized protein (TIGR02246 family)